MRGVNAQEVETIIAELNARYTAEARPYEIIREGFGYRMTFRNQFTALREKYYGRMRRVRLSQAAIEVLALVAYNEPLTSDEVAPPPRHRQRKRSAAPCRAANCCASNAPETKPRKAKYFTTQRFLDVFHLRNLSDLPRSEELEPR